MKPVERGALNVLQGLEIEKRNNELGATKRRKEHAELSL
jgi:hypothetical protein